MSWLSNLFNPSKSFPKHITDYVESCSISRKNRFKELEFVVFDTETTSLDIKKLQLISIGAVACSIDSIQVDDVFNRFLAVDKDHLENVPIHGITKRQLTAACEPKQVIDDFLVFIRGKVLIAQHANFDVGVINRYLQEFYPGLKLKNPVLDTADLAIRLEHNRMDISTVNRKMYSLDALLKRYRIQAVERHSALGDAYTTALLFMKLMAGLQKKGIERLSDL